jgi:uncharacterized protein (TIGR00730 family)
MHRICVYLGSREGASPHHRQQAEALGAAIAERGWGLVYGGARAGLMGALADAALAAGGEVVGVIPQALVRNEKAHTGLTRLIEVADMHERKAQMAALADGFVTLPGGIGTLEELFETWTWQYLRFHAKPIAVLDSDGFYAPLLEFLDRTVEAGFLDADTRARLISEREITPLLDRLAPSSGEQA